MPMCPLAKARLLDFFPLSLWSSVDKERYLGLPTAGHTPPEELMSPAVPTVGMRGEGTSFPPASFTASGNVWGLLGLGSEGHHCSRRKQAIPKGELPKIGR